VFEDLLQHGLDLRMVGRGEREQRDFLVAGGVQDVADGVHDLGDRALANGARDCSRLAEAAAARAAPVDFDDATVMRDLDVGHQLADRGGGQRRHKALANARWRGCGGRCHCGNFAGGCVVRAVKSRDVQSFDVQQRVKLRFAGEVAHCVPRLHQFDEGVFSFTDDEDVEEVGDGFGVEGAVPAADDQRMRRVAVGTVDGESGQIEKLEGVGVELLVGDADGEDVETGDRPVAFECVERDAGPAHLRDHIRCGKVGAFGQDVGPAVEGVVKDGQREVGHPQVVYIGEGQTDANVSSIPRLVNSVVFTAYVAPWFPDAVQERFDGFPGDGPHRGHS